MLRRPLLAAAMTAVLASTTAPVSHPHATADAPTLDAPTLDAPTIDRVVEEYRGASGIPGAAVVVTRGDAVVHAGGHGTVPGGEPVTEHTPMAVASVSKSITALAVLQLVEAGRVDLDQPVHRYLPEFTMADPRASAITVRQLLDQTSGLSDSTFPSFSRPRPGSLAESVAGMRDARLATDPGTRWAYYNPNFQVAARLVEVVGGRPFGDHLRQHVFGPLGMNDSTTIDTEGDLPPSAHGHLKILGAPVAMPEPPAFGNGSGGVLSSASDMGAWLIAQNNHGRGPNGTSVVSAAAVTEMHTPSSAVSGSYGLGWTVGTTPSGAPMISHSGDLFTATAYQALLPDSGYGLAVMTNTGTAFGDATGLAGRLIALLDGSPVPSAGASYVVVDAVLLAIGVAVLLLGGLGVRRARRWAAARRSRWGTVVRLLPTIVPGVLLAVVHLVVRMLYRGRDVTWLQVSYLYPTFMLLLVVAALAGAGVLAARLVALPRCARSALRGRCVEGSLARSLTALGTLRGGGRVARR